MWRLHPFTSSLCVSATPAGPVSNREWNKNRSDWLTTSLTSSEWRHHPQSQMRMTSHLQSIHLVKYNSRRMRWFESNFHDRSLSDQFDKCFIWQSSHSFLKTVLFEESTDTFTTLQASNSRGLLICKRKHFSAFWKFSQLPVTFLFHMEYGPKSIEKESQIPMALALPVIDQTLLSFVRKRRAISREIRTYWIEVRTVPGLFV